MKRFALDFGEYEFHQHYIIAKPAEGTLAGRREFALLSVHIRDYYCTPFGFIANRVNHSSANLSIYKKITQQHPLLKAIAIVSYRPLTSLIAETERLLFLKVAFNIFKDVTTARIWVLDTLGVKE